MQNMEAHAAGAAHESTIVQTLADDGTLPSNALPLVVFRGALSHKNLGASPDFAVVGAYPDGQRFDMNYGKAGERPGAGERIAKVTLPRMDPVRGADGPLLRLWGTARPGKP